MIKVLRAPTNSSAIDFIYSTALEESVNDRTALIIPTMRALKEVASLKLQNVDLFTIKEFLEFTSVSKKRKIDKRLRSFYLKKVASSLSVDDSKNIFHNNQDIFLNNYSSFDNISINLLAFFRELSAECISVDELYKAGKYTDYEEQAKSLMNLWYSYNDLLDESNLVEPWNLYSNEDLGYLVKRYDKFIFFIGGYLSKHELNKIKNLSKNSDIVIIFNFVGSKNSHYTLYENFFDIEIPDADAMILNRDNCEILRANSLLSQIELITFRAAYYNKVNNIPYERMSILLVDDSLKSYFLRYDKYNLFNITANENIDKTAIFQLLKSALNIKILIDRNSKQSITLEVLKEFYYEIFLTSLEDLEEVRKVIDEKIAHNNIFIPIAELSVLPFFNHYFELINKLNDELPIPQLIDYIKEFLKAVKENLSKSEVEIFSNLMQLLDQLKSVYSPIDDKLSLEDSIYIILNDISTLKVNTGRGGITVSGILESRALDYDVVFVPELNDDIFPPTSRKDLFLNTEMRLDLKLPTYLDRESLIKNYLLQIISRSKKTVLSFTKSDDTRNSSSFINELIFKYNLKTKNYFNKEYNLFDVKKYDKFIDKNNIVANDGTIFKTDKIVEKIKSNKLSASAFNDYINCSLKYFYKRIMRVYETVEMATVVSPMMIGNILHKILEVLHTKNISVTDKHYLDSVREIHEEIISNYDVFTTSRPSKFIQDEIITIFKDIVDVELERIKEGYETLEVEKNYEYKTEGLILHGKIDRIDFNHNSREIDIIDYKFKSADKLSTVMKPTLDKYEDFQLPFYYFLYSKNKNVEPTSLYQVSLSESYQYVKVFDTDLSGEAEVWIRSKLIELQDINIPFTRTENKKICTYCEYALICEGRV